MSYRTFTIPYVSPFPDPAISGTRGKGKDFLPRCITRPLSHGPAAGNVCSGRFGVPWFRRAKEGVSRHSDPPRPGAGREVPQQQITWLQKRQVAWALSQTDLDLRHESLSEFWFGVCDVKFPVFEFDSYDIGGCCSSLNVQKPICTYRCTRAKSCLCSKSNFLA